MTGERPMRTDGQIKQAAWQTVRGREGGGKAVGMSGVVEVLLDW